MKTEPIEIKVKDFIPSVGELYLHPRPLYFVAKQKPDEYGTHIIIHDEEELKYARDKTVSEIKIDGPIMFVENTGRNLEDLVNKNGYLRFALEDDLHKYTIWKALIGESCFFVLCSRLDCWQFKKIT